VLEGLLYGENSHLPPQNDETADKQAQNLEGYLSTKKGCNLYHNLGLQ